MFAQPSPDLYTMIKYLDEAGRNREWLRCLLEEDDKAHITQAALWQDYKQRFGQSQIEGIRTLLPSVDIFKNVINCFHGKAIACILDGKFVIRGIRYWSEPIDFNEER
jgi:hypothetical protein